MCGVGNAPMRKFAHFVRDVICNGESTALVSACNGFTATAAVQRTSEEHLVPAQRQHLTTNTARHSVNASRRDEEHQCDRELGLPQQQFDVHAGSFSMKGGESLLLQIKYKQGMQLPNYAAVDDGKEMVRVPLRALNEAIVRAKAALAEKKALKAELERLDAEVHSIGTKLQERQDQLERCASFRPDLHRPSAKSNPRATFTRSCSKSSMLTSSIRDLLGEQAEELDNLVAREESHVLMALILHAADLSGQALPYEQAVRWGMRVLTEFQNQAKSEAEMKVPVDSYMTNLHQMKTRITVQMNFINYVLRPIWLPLATVCKQLRVYADSLESNFESYKADLDRILGEQHDRLPVNYVRGESSRMLTKKKAPTRHNQRKTTIMYFGCNVIFCC
ncbi:3'5'-cyclic nucleotide phosphodiesterase, partial [Globisporangium splendens]